MADIAIADRFGCEGKLVVLNSRAHFQSAPDARLALDALAIQRLEQRHQRRRIQARPRCRRGAGQTFELRYAYRLRNFLLRRAVIEDEIDHPLRLRRVADGTRHHIEMQIDIRKPGPDAKRAPPYGSPDRHLFVPLPPRERSRHGRRGN